MDEDDDIMIFVAMYTLVRLKQRRTRRRRIMMGLRRQGLQRVFTVLPLAPLLILFIGPHPGVVPEILETVKFVVTGSAPIRENDMTRMLEKIPQAIILQGACPIYKFLVAPAELEDILRSHPNVADAAVIGIPDARTGEAPLAFIVLANESASTKNLERDIQEFVAGKVSNHKHIKEVRIVKGIPKNPDGKIIRKKN